MAVFCCGPFLKGDAAFPNLLKNCEIQSEFSRVKKSEDLTEGFNLSRGNGKCSGSKHFALHRVSLAYLGRHRVCSLAALCAADVMILGKPTHDVNNKIKKTFGAVFKCRNICTDHIFR